MALKPGTKLGTYELLTLIGAGGMGEVYKARDAKLNRLVAIKVLPPSLASDPALLARFDREAKAVAALSHANVLGIFDLGSQDGITYAVMELLEGESLRDKLKGGALPPKRALEIATELAQGLGAAHERGIVHRDVKPENIFITSDGRVKVLDFGLAKQVAEPRSATADLETEAISLTPNGTEAGMVLGTVGYMSPEQVKGEPADHRADIFAFGVVLYELLSGQRPFQGETSVQTMAAILDEDPPALVAARGTLPPALERLVAHCLEKNPKARFQSMHDLAYDLQNLSQVSSSTQPSAAPKRRGGRFAPALLTAALLLVTLALLGWADLLRLGRPTFPSFTRLTHTPGTIEAAYFGPDGRTVYFSERIQGGRPELFVLHPGSAEPKPLGIRDALLLGVSASGDLAILEHPGSYFGASYRGTLAQTGPDGGSVRGIRENVVNAVWDGTGFTTLTDREGVRIRLEAAGRILLEGDPGGCYPRSMCRSRDAAQLAVIFADTTAKTEILWFDRSGRRTVAFTKFGDTSGDTLTGLAWGPDGDLWFSELLGDQTAVWSLTRKGSRRMLWRGEGTKVLMDVSADGRMLLIDQQVRRGVLVQRPGDASPRDLSIASGTQTTGFSADGRMLLLMESPVMDGGTAQDQTFVWNAQSGQTVRISAGTPGMLTADGRWASVNFAGADVKDLDPGVAEAIRGAGLDPKAALDPFSTNPCVVFIPTGVGQPFAVAIPPNLPGLGIALLTSDERTILFNAAEKDAMAWYAMNRQGGPAKKLTPPDFGAFSMGLTPLATDDSRLIVRRDSSFYLVPLAGGAPVPIRGLGPQDRVICLTRDQKSVLIRPMEPPIVVQRLDLATGARRPVFSWPVGDLSGLLQIRGVYTPPEAGIFALNYIRKLSNLYLVDGLR